MGTPGAQDLLDLSVEPEQQGQVERQVSQVAPVHLELLVLLVYQAVPVRLEARVVQVNLVPLDQAAQSVLLVTLVEVDMPALRD